MLDVIINASKFRKVKLADSHRTKRIRSPKPVYYRPYFCYLSKKHAFPHRLSPTSHGRVSCLQKYAITITLYMEYNESKSLLLPVATNVCLFMQWAPCGIHICLSVLWQVKLRKDILPVKCGATWLSWDRMC